MPSNGWRERKGLWLIVIGPTVWALHFLLCYISAAILCEKVGQLAVLDWLRIAIGFLTLVALAVNGVVLSVTWRQWGFFDDFTYAHSKPTDEDRHRFIGHAAFLLSALATIGIVYTALPVIFIGGCR